MTYTKYSWHRYTDNIYWTTTDEYLIFPQHGLLNLVFIHLEHHTFSIQKLRSPFSVARAVQGRHFWEYILNISPFSAVLFVLQSLSNFSSQAGLLQALTGKRNKWQFVSANCSWFLDHTPPLGYGPVEANKPSDQRQQDICNSKLTRSCLEKL